MIIIHQPNQVTHYECVCNVSDLIGKKYSDQRNAFIGRIGISTCDQTVFIINYMNIASLQYPNNTWSGIESQETVYVERFVDLEVTVKERRQ